MPPCREAQPDRHPEGNPRLWTVNLCANALFIPDVQPEGLEIQDGFEPGFFAIRSAHPVRAIDVAEYGPEEEVCRIHWGQMDARGGFAAPRFCSKPYAVGDDLDELHEAYPYLFPGNDPNDTDPLDLEAGFFVFAASYHTPWWTEAHYNSAREYCPVPV